jgi:hypothetical protein
MHFVFDEMQMTVAGVVILTAERFDVFEDL